MSLREFARLGGEKWSSSFASKFGKAASKFYREIYGKDRPMKRAGRDWRNKVGRYPCGILENAYRQLTNANSVAEEAHQELCGNVWCRRYPLTTREFGKLRGQKWRAFASKLGKAASDFYREIYGKAPPKKRVWRASVGKYPRGILEQAYRMLTDGNVRDASTGHFSGPYAPRLRRG